MSEDIQPTEIQQGVAKVALVDTLKSVVKSAALDTDPALTMFLGTQKEQHEKIYKVATTFLSMQSAMKDNKEREAAIFKKAFEDLREIHFKDVPQDVLEPLLASYFRFYFNGLDRTLVRGEVIETLKREGWTNTLPHAGLDGQRLSAIHAQVPSIKGNESVRERMRRSYMKTSGSPDVFTVILYNSLIVLKVKVPTMLDRMRLINQIETKLVQYGSRYNLSSLHLERAGIGQILVEFLLTHATQWSVKDTLDPMALKKLIYSNDLNVIAQTLLAVGSPKGVVFRMYCLADQCDHSENVVIDPTGMILDVEESIPKERLELMNEILTKGRKLSREELADLTPKYIDETGADIDTVIEFNNEFGKGRLTLAVPYLDEYFACFGRMANRVNPELRQLAVDFPNPKQYQVKRNEHMAAIRMADYLQWFHSFEMDAEPGSGEPPTITYRAEDPAEFEEALIDIFNTDGDLYEKALYKVLTVGPRMTYTFVGIRDDECPACRKRVGENIQAINRGFTPIDPIINFFDHTRMMISLRGDQQTLQEDNLS